MQGVGFRATARSIASGFDITGWVRNEPDGSVVLQAQGTAAEVERYMVAVRERMAGLITAESADSLEVIPGDAGFEVQR